MESRAMPDNDSAEQTTDEDLQTDELPQAEEVVEAEAVEPATEDLQKLQAEKTQLYDQLLRLKAEFENFRKRADREKPALIAHGKTELLERLIPLYDVLLTAHDHIEAHDAKSSAGELAKGLEMIFGEFTKLFKTESVTIIASVGEKYDFNKHEVLGQVETDEHEDGIVVEELQRGYLLGERVLRAAKVRVSKKK
jgi:molecular chaperone GrpE